MVPVLRPTSGRGAIAGVPAIGPCSTAGGSFRVRGPTAASPVFRGTRPAYSGPVPPTPAPASGLRAGTTS